MSKTKLFSKNSVFIIIILALVIFIIYFYTMSKKEKFGNKNKDLKSALDLVSQYKLPDILQTESLATLTPKLPFSNIKESFYGMGPNTINSFANSNSNTSTKNWNNPNLCKKSKAVNNILNRPSQPIPLPEGELDMFATTQFKPQCCPNTFSNSMGCACMTVNQYKYLINRGGNNVPYSEY